MHSYILLRIWPWCHPNSLAVRIWNYFYDPGEMVWSAPALFDNLCMCSRAHLGRGLGMGSQWVQWQCPDLGWAFIDMTIWPARFNAWLGFWHSQYSSVCFLFNAYDRCCPLSAICGLVGVSLSSNYCHLLWSTSIGAFLRYCQWMPDVQPNFKNIEYF